MWDTKEEEIIEEEVSNAVSLYGWTYTKEGENRYFLYNRNGKQVVDVVIKGSKYKLLDTIGNKLVDGNGKIGDGISHLLEKYYYAQKIESNSDRRKQGLVDSISDSLNILDDIDIDISRSLDKFVPKDDGFFKITGQGNEYGTRYNYDVSYYDNDKLFEGSWSVSDKTELTARAQLYKELNKRKLSPFIIKYINEIPERVPQELPNEDSSSQKQERAALYIRGRVETAREEQQGLSNEQERVIQKKAALEFAKQNDIWIKELYSLGSPSGGGSENTLAYNTEDGFVYKSNNLSNYHDDILKLFDSVNYHNEIFDCDKYEFVGFTGIDNGANKTPYIEPIFRQFYLEDANQATASEIEGLMKELGFEKVNDYTFKNDKYIVSDLKPRNVLKDKDGNICVIDDIVKLNSMNIGDTVKYTAGDVDKETWYGIITKVVDTGIYRLDAFNINYRQMDMSATNEKYAAQLTKIDSQVYRNRLKDWRDEHSKKSTKSEFDDKRQKLDEFFTPDWVADIMVNLAYKHGYKGGYVLEPSFGHGVFFDRLANDGVTDFTGFEIYKPNFDHVQAKYPDATLYNTYFEYAFLSDKDFKSIQKFEKNLIKPDLKKEYDLIIGNPPYGDHKSPHAYLFDSKLQIRAEGFFLWLCAQKLAKNGVMVMLLPSLWLHNGEKYNKQKMEISKYLELVDAYRLPNNVFEKTKIATDILVFKRK